METASLYRPFRVSNSPWVWLLLLVLVATMLFPMYAGLRSFHGLRTLAYEVTPGEVIIHFAFDRVRIETDQITRIYEVTPTPGHAG